jgi:hypothetical protein
MKNKRLIPEVQLKAELISMDDNIIFRDIYNI